LIDNRANCGSSQPGWCKTSRLVAGKKALCHSGPSCCVSTARCLRAARCARQNRCRRFCRTRRYFLAERVRFELTMVLLPCRFSRPVHSTALPPLRTATSVSRGDFTRQQMPTPARRTIEQRLPAPISAATGLNRRPPRGGAKMAARATGGHDGQFSKQQRRIS
jgi:hypothetical protein